MAAPLTTGFSHLVVNVSDLERSLEIYEKVTPLRLATRTTPPTQAFETLGVAEGRFTGAILRDPGVPLAPAVNLVQWLEPKPSGRTYPSFTNPGFFRICFQTRDAVGAHERVVAAGLKPNTDPLLRNGQREVGYPVFGAPDPDGVVLQYITLGEQERLYHTCCNCTDLAADVAFWEALGLRVCMRLETDEPEPFSFGAPHKDATFAAAPLDHPEDVKPDGSPSFTLDLVRWKDPPPTGEPYASQTNLGIVRLGMTARDLEAARSALQAKGYRVSDIETRDYGAPTGTRRAFLVRNNDGAVVELVERPL